MPKSISIQFNTLCNLNKISSVLSHPADTLFINKVSLKTLCSAWKSIVKSSEIPWSVWTVFIIFSNIVFAIKMVIDLVWPLKKQIFKCSLQQLKCKNIVPINCNVSQLCNTFTDLTTGSSLITTKFVELKAVKLLMVFWWNMIIMSELNHPV